MLVLAAAAFLFTQPPAEAPQGAPPTPPPEFIEAAQAFGQCIAGGSAKLAATVTPEAGATQVAAGCSTQKAALETQFETWVSGANFPEAGRGIAREQFRSQISQVETMIADGIRKSREAPAPRSAE